MATTERKGSPPTVVDTPMEDAGRPSGFTAVNGAAASRDSPRPNGNIGSPRQHDNPRPSDESLPTAHVQAPKSSTVSQSVSPSTNGTPGDALRNGTPASVESPPTRKRSYPDAFTEPENRAYYAKMAPAPTGDSEKRAEAHHNHDPYQQPPATRPEAPETPDQQHAALPAQHHSERQQQRPLASDFDPHASVPHPYYPQHNNTQPAHGDTEQRLVEALRRDNDDPHDHSDNGYGGSPDPDEMGGPPYGGSGEYSTSRSGAVQQIDGDRKRRKRVFSNRTKTGCMTCRKRKKKCDESKPECQNCLRGGFVCEGYSVRNTWQKPTPSKPPVPLQSKTGGVASASQLAHEATAYPSPTPYRASTQVDPQYGAMASKDVRPSDDGRRLTPPSLERSGAGPWPSQPPYAPPPQAGAKYSDGRPVGAHDDPHALAEQASYPPMSTHHHHPPAPAGPSAGPAHPAAAHGPPHSSHSQAPPPPPSSTTLAHPSASPVSSKRPHADSSERDKMLRGEYYLPYTPALIADRDQCTQAIWTFNNAALNPATGYAAGEERMALFRKVMALRPTADPEARGGGGGAPGDPEFMPRGTVGASTIVEAPFYCDYGYNISIGSDVIIGPECRITDTCSVRIGDGVVFSPGVKLVCATYAIDPRERRKGLGRALGRNIVIEENAWIGSNVTILPGVRVGRCSTVGAGSLLHKDVPPFTVVAGNPPKVVRGIYEDGRN